MNYRRLLTLPLDIITHFVDDKMDDFDIIISLAEIIQQNVSVAQFLDDEDNDNDENISRKRERIGRGRGNPVLGTKSKYVYRQGAANAFYRSV